MIDNSNLFTFSFALKEIGLKKHKIEKILGYEPDASPSPFTEWIDEIFEYGQKIMKLQGGYILFDNPIFKKENYTINVSGLELVVEKTIFHKLTKATKLAVFACTAGEEFTNWSSDIMKNDDMTKGYIADTIASEAVELAMDKIQDELLTIEKNKGNNTSNRYSPGYCNWNIIDQQKIFRLLPEKFCGITLSESSLMYPIKSVSGIIGIGPGIKKAAYGCSICDSQDCIYRRLRH